MGWFDDSDEEEETRKKRPLPLDFFETTLPKKVSERDHENEEPEDPLDTFMSGVQAAVKQAEKSSCPRKGDCFINGSNSSNRLDVENEEEATAHWTASNRNDKVDSDHLFASYDEDTETSSKPINSTYPQSSYESIRTKATMASIFHKAGERQVKQRTSNKNETRNLNEAGPYDSEEEDMETEAKKSKRTIEPLEKDNNKSIDYHPYRKCFVKEKDMRITAVGSNWRKENTVTCSIDVKPIVCFEDYGSICEENDGTERESLFPPSVLKYLSQNGYREATLVQAQAIPVALSGRDLLVTSQTGSGKTLAYVLPLIVHILDQPHIQPGVDGAIALILTPTRELARQVHLVCKKILNVVGAKVIAVTGGMGTYEMSKELKKGCEVLVVTPGRLIEMVKKKVTNLHRVTLVILDEADKMLEMGFETQVSSILNNTRSDRQSWMYSATLGKRVERVAKGWLRDPVRVAVGRTGSSSDHVIQHVLVLPNKNAKIQWLLEMLPTLTNIGKVIIFVASRSTCEEVLQLMRKSTGKKMLVDSIHGDKHQSDRNTALSSFRKGKIVALVATDVAARGLDIADVQTVVNFDAAKNLDSHVHRVGRAGRLVKNNNGDHEHNRGVAYTLLLDPLQSDFAKLLIDVFQREGREISDELMQLSLKKRGNKWNKKGLGHH